MRKIGKGEHLRANARVDFEISSEAMAADWVCKAVAYALRYRSGKWREFQVI